MSFIELLDRVLPRFRSTPEHRSTRRAVRMNELSDEWASALAQADYSHLPSREDARRDEALAVKDFRDR